MRYFFEISYNGLNYNGWQSQLNATGIQTIVEDCLRKIFRRDLKITGSGRTDTGVHCEQQFFHVDIDQTFDAASTLLRLNSCLPKDIAIHSIVEVNPEASARYDARERTYQYRIVRRKNVFTPGLAWFFFKPVNIANMNKAAALLLGNHDFQCFSKVKTDVNNFICEVKAVKWEEKGDNLVFTITANRFLRGMVRAIVGTLLDVGSDKTTLEEFKKILISKDRKAAGANVPPYGLYLMKVKYPQRIFKVDKEIMK